MATPGAGETCEWDFDLGPLALGGRKPGLEGHFAPTVFGIGAEAHLVGAAVALDPQHDALGTTQIQLHVPGPQRGKAAVVFQRQCAEEAQDAVLADFTLALRQAAHDTVIDDAPFELFGFLRGKLGHRPGFGSGSRQAGKESGGNGGSGFHGLAISHRIAATPVEILVTRPQHYITLPPATSRAHRWPRRAMSRPPRRGGSCRRRPWHWRGCRRRSCRDTSRRGRARPASTRRCSRRG